MTTAFYPQCRKRFERSHETNQLLALIRDRITQTSDLPFDITYEELGAAAGQTIDGSSRCLRSAQKILQAEDSRVVRCVRGIGIRVHDTQGIYERQAGHISRQRRAARRARMEGHCMELHRLPAAERSRALLNQSLFGLLELAGRERRLKAIHAKIEQPKLLSLGEMLAALK